MSVWLSQVDWTAAAALLSAIFTGIYTIGTFLLWRANQKTIKLLAEQIKNQIAFNESAALHTTINAHRDLFFEVLRDKELRRLFAKESGLGDEVVQSDFLATLLINHACRMFMDYHLKLVDPKGLDSFSRDAKDLFSMPFIKKRWEEVRLFHAPDFVEFIDKRVMI